MINVLGGLCTPVEGGMRCADVLHIAGCLACVRGHASGCTREAGAGATQRLGPLRRASAHHTHVNQYDW